jgi:hypothetical protein
MFAPSHQQFGGREKTGRASKGLHSVSLSCDQSPWAGGKGATCAKAGRIQCASRRTAASCSRNEWLLKVCSGDRNIPLLHAIQLCFTHCDSDKTVLQCRPTRIAKELHRPQLEPIRSQSRLLLPQLWFSSALPFHKPMALWRAQVAMDPAAGIDIGSHHNIRGVQSESDRPERTWIIKCRVHAVAQQKAMDGPDAA